MTLLASKGGGEGKGGYTTGVTSLCACCGVKVLKGTRRSGAYAVPKMSLGSRSQNSVMGMVYRPEPTNCSEGS